MTHQIQLVEAPPAPPKLAKKAILRVIQDQGSNTQQISQDSDIALGKTETYLQELVEEGSIVKIVRGGEILYTRARKASSVDRIKAALADNPALLAPDGREYDGGGDPKKAEKLAEASTYNINRGVARQWNDTDPDLVSEKNPMGLKYYAVYRQTGEGVFERVIGDRRHLPEQWAEFVQSAGSRVRKKSDADPEDETSADSAEKQSAIDDVVDDDDDVVHEAADTVDEVGDTVDDTVRDTAG